jgi:acyl-homoserine-lactone acylase
MRRVLKGVGLVLVLLLVGAFVWEPLAVSEAAPPPSRTYDARIVRDEFGVPHIFGKTDADTAFGLAFAHAEDDFSTIEDVLAMTRGRYGALIGSEGAKVDYVLHLLRARETGARDYPRLPADVRAMLDGYAAGLNRYAAAHPDEVRLRKLFPVNGEDVATGFVLRSPFFFGLDSVIGALSGGKPPPAESAEPMTPAGRTPDMNGSNAFAVAPKRMADGRTWLVSNSHQPYEGNVAWYEAVVHSGEGLDMAGALFPGSPFVLLGHNRTLGWTNTVNRPDLIDVYKLTLDESGKRYRFDGKWKDLETQRVWLPVRFGPLTIPVPRTVTYSIHGPVIVNDTGAFAIRYAGIDQAKMVEQYYRIGKARDWAEWTKAMSVGGIPATNFIYADRTGRIAYIYNALFPDRKPGFDYTKVLPGDRSAALWSASLGFDRMPKIVDPQSGFVTNANNTPFLSAGPGSEMNPADYSPLLGIELRLTNRGLRSVELMAADSSITPEELLAIKFDTAYSRASYVKPWMDRILALDLKDDPELARAQALLRGWDWKSDGQGGADVLAELMVRAANGANYRGDPLPEPRQELAKWVDHLKIHAGRIDPPLGEWQRLRRGSVDLPLPEGGTDVLRATSIWDKTEKDGKGRVKHGDSFIMLMNWDEAGKVRSQSIQPYGSATTRPQSPHYTDQMKLFVERRFKPVHFEPSDLARNAKRAYRIN